MAEQDKLIILTSEGKREIETPKNGSVTLIYQKGKLVQIDTTDKNRLV